MKYSFKKICIEAPFPTTQCGHSCQTFLVDTFKDHLYARAVAFKDDNNWIIHLSMDLLAFDLKHRNALQDKLREYYHNDNLHLITSTTHTHYANSIRDDKYKEWLMTVLFDGITSMEYVEKGNIYSTYQRKHTNACGKSRISGYETNNEYLCLLRFYDDNNDNFFNIVINNCHPTTLAATSPFFSAEYPGYVLKLLEEDNNNSDYTFIQGAAGDISSRFVRNGQEYEHMVELAQKLFKEITDLMAKNIDKKPLTLDYYEIPVSYEHDFSPIDLSKIRADLSPRELETIKGGQEIRARVATPDEHGIFGNVIKQAIISTWKLGSLQIIFYPNEIFSAYMDGLNLDEKMLVSYSNGYGPYILPIDFPFITYEMFLDTLTNTCKEKIKEIINTI